MNNSIRELLALLVVAIGLTSMIVAFLWSINHVAIPQESPEHIAEHICMNKNSELYSYSNELGRCKFTCFNEKTKERFECENFEGCYCD